MATTADDKAMTAQISKATLQGQMNSSTYISILPMLVVAWRKTVAPALPATKREPFGSLLMRSQLCLGLYDLLNYRYLPSQVACGMRIEHLLNLF